MSQYQTSKYIIEPKQHGTGTKRHEDQSNSRNGPQIKCTSTLIWPLTKEPKTYTGEKAAFSTNGAGKTG
jgi:hypothetical protein